MKNLKLAFIISPFIISSCFPLSFDKAGIISGLKSFDEPRKCITPEININNSNKATSNTCIEPEISEVKTISGIALGKLSHAAIKGNLTFYLKSNGFISESSFIELNELEIVTLKNSSIRNAPNLRVINQAVRVTSINVNANNQIENYFLEEKFRELSTNVTFSSASNKTIIISGLNLFLAYTLTSTGDARNNSN